jgi:asparagine synthase (glutamine-hydrolysing)
MCGICGAVTEHAVEDALISPMLETLAHRGPDGVAVDSLGRAAFGHRRLSILDPRTDGDQPMRSPDGTLLIVHNGEIYNFIELRLELEQRGHHFRTETDTEVILAAYREWGPDAVQRFNGIWAFALWDETEQRLLLSRDRFGVKPMFIREADGRLEFGSEIKAFLGSGAVATPNFRTIRRFLLDGLVDDQDETFFEGIRRLPAASNLLIARDTRREWRYWEAPELGRDPSFADDGRDAGRVGAFRSMLLDSVALQLRSDVPLGSCLSGGMDSSSIVAIAAGIRAGTLTDRPSRDARREAYPQIGVFAEFHEPAITERRFVDDVVRRTGISLVTTRPTGQDFVRELEAIVWHQDEPFASTSIVAQYFVMRAARDAGLKVLLDGQGADELLGGYPANAAPRYGGAARSRSAPAFAKRLVSGGVPSSLARVSWYAAFGARRPPTSLRTSRVLVSHLGEALRHAASESRPRSAGRPGTVLATNMWRDVVSTNLPALLRYEDRNSMAFGLEARVPFLDHRLVELAVSLPDRLKIDGIEHKVALRRAMRGIVPESVIERRDKVGFATPEDSWLRESVDALLPLATESATERGGALQVGTLSWAFDAWRRRRLATPPFWRLLSLELCWRVTVNQERGVVDLSRR